MPEATLLTALPSRRSALMTSCILLEVPGQEMPLLLGGSRQASSARCIHIAPSSHYVIYLFKLSRKHINLLPMIKPHPSHSLNKNTPLSCDPICVIKELSGAGVCLEKAQKR